MSATSASAAAATGESEQRRAPPAPMPPLSRCTDSSLRCSASNYEALLADASGLLYDCGRQGKVDDIRFILDVWSRRRLHLACANGHAGLVRLLLSRGTTNVASNGSGNPRLNEFKVEDGKRTRGRQNERTRGRHEERQLNNQPAQDNQRAAE